MRPSHGTKNGWKKLPFFLQTLGFIKTSERITFFGLQRVTSLFVFGPVERMRVYSIIAEIIYGIFRHCATFFNFLFVRSVIPSLSKMFSSWENCFASLKPRFRHYETFSRQKLSKKNQKDGFLFPVGEKVVFEYYAYTFGYFRH